MYLAETLYYLSWPAFIYVSYLTVRIAVITYEKKFEDI